MSNGNKFAMSVADINKAVDKKRMKRKIEAQMKRAKMAGSIKAKAWNPDPTWSDKN